ncbi:protein FAM221B [Octodon degus]|uniref:Protein FAM221B n=1 Tax=Octodon degus TaxID=10160 RepID=A0A6P6EHH9_OCTDE|nr:protein FAM221B [Octodon degus]
MEADRIAEEEDIATTMDAKEHPSSKDPSAEDLQALPTSETPLEPSVSETPLEPLAAETPLQSHTSKPPLVSSVTGASVSPSDALGENLLSESPSREVQWVKRSSQVPEFEHLPEHSLSGSSIHVYRDTSSKQKEEAEKDKNIVDTSDMAHTAQPGYQQHKKKGKKGIIRYTGHPVVPAKQAELVEMAKAMHREQFGAQMNHLFQWEKDAALNAIQTGLYIGWRCPHYLWDCYRIGDESKCFCGHLLKQHQIISDISVPCNVSQCHCIIFCFIPSRPEEVGEFWLRRRATFNPKAWRAQCRCKHSHEDHAANGAHPCRHHGCSCNGFESNFLCAACDKRWEEHETYFETKETRRRGRRPYGADYVPFAEMPDLQEAITNNLNFEARQAQGLSHHSSSQPSPPALPGPSGLQSGPKFDPNT